MYRQEGNPSEESIIVNWHTELIYYINYFATIVFF